MRSSIFSSLSVLSFRVVVCALVILAAVAAVAQSGRRGAPRTPPSAETKQPEDKTEPSEPQRQDLIIGTDRSEVLAKVPLYLYESVLLSCSRRLDESHAVRVDVVSKDMNRGDAVSSAKSQKAAYVVWLQLRTDGISDYTANDALSALHIDYTIFEPLTARVKAQGRCYQLQYKGGVIAPRTSGTNNTPLIERRLKDAAREAADRVLKALDIALPADGGG